MLKSLLTPELRTAMCKHSETFAPQWAYIKTPETSSGNYSPLGMQWVEQVPISNTNDGSSEWQKASYLGWVTISVPVTSSGQPASIPDASGADGGFVQLCEAYGFVVLTNERIMAKLDGGFWLGNKYGEDRSLLVNIPHRQLMDATVPVKRGLRGEKYGATEIRISGPNIAVIRVKPDAGLNDPWNAADRGVWQRKVSQLFFAHVVETARGTPPTESETMVVFKALESQPEEVKEWLASPR